MPTCPKHVGRFESVLSADSAVGEGRGKWLLHLQPVHQVDFSRKNSAENCKQKAEVLFEAVEVNVVCIYVQAALRRNGR